MKIYLHIGTHKTGTTSIQNFASKNTAFLAKYNVVWPTSKLDSYPSQHSYIKNLIKSKQIDVVKDFVAATMKEADSINATAILLSGESLGEMNSEDIELFLSLLKPHEVEVLVNYRNIYDYAISLYSQLLKATSQNDVYTAIIPALANRLNYSSMIDRWDLPDSKCTVSALSYDAIKDDLLFSFFSKIGIPHTPLKQKIDGQKVTANKSIDISTQLFLASIGFNSSTKDYQRTTRRIYHKFHTYPDYKSPFEGSLAKMLVDQSGFDVNHPKLNDIRELLTKEPEVKKRDPVRDREDRLNFLEATTDYFSLLARTERGLKFKPFKRLKLWLEKKFM